MKAANEKIKSQKNSRTSGTPGSLPATTNPRRSQDKIKDWDKAARINQPSIKIGTLIQVQRQGKPSWLLALSRCPGYPDQTIRIKSFARAKT